nr:hypothetical protein [Candidatus Ichthyocystis sparus]
MNPVTGVSVAGPIGDDDQADSGDLQQVQILPGSVLDVATTVTAVSTIAATSSVVTISTVLTASATTSTVATTSVGKGSSGGRSDKGKGPASKRCAAGSVVYATSVNPTHASTNPELSGPTSSVTTAACTRAADFDIILNFVTETARTRRAAVADADARASFAAASAAAAAARADALTTDYTDPGSASARALASARAMGKYARDVAARAAAARAAAAAADFVVDQARAFAAVLIVAQDRAADSIVSSLGGADFNIILNSVVDTARDCRAAADIADASANSAAAAAARANSAADAAARARDITIATAARAYSSASDNNPAAARVCARRARARARAAGSYYRTLATRAAAARAAAAAADIAAAQARAFAAGCVVVQDLAADSSDPDSDPISNSSCTAAVAGSSTSSLLPDSSSLMPPGFVDLFGFVVSLEFSEVVNKLISGVRALAKDIIPYYIIRTVSNIFRNLSSSERRAWCLTNGKLYELKFVARCFAAYSIELLPTFINTLRSARTWDSSSRSLMLLTGNRLADFWASLDESIFEAITGFFVSRWCGLIDRLFVMSGPEEGSSALCGGDFVSACAKSDTSSSSVSIFDSASEGMRVRVAPHGGDSVDLFGFEVPPGVQEMVNVLTREVSELAKRTYSSVVAVPVSRTMMELSSSEQCAWLITNMTLYKTSFLYRFFLDYCGGLCSEFICSLFRVIPGDTYGRSLLSLTGNSLRGFWLSLSETIMRIVQDIFASEWQALISQFSVISGPGEESSSTVLCVRDFINARDKAGVPNLATSGSGLSIRVRGAARRRAVSHVTEVTSGSSVLGFTTTTTTASTSTSTATSASASAVSPPLESPPLFFMEDEIGLSFGVVESEVLVVTEGSGEGVMFVDDGSSVSEGELVGRTSLSEEEALAVDSAPSTSTSEMLVLAGEEEVEVSVVVIASSSPVLAREEEVEVSEVVLPMVGAAVPDLGVLEGELSELTVVPATSAFSVTTSSATSSSVVEVEEYSTTIPTIGSPALRIGSSGGRPVAPKKLFMSMYRSGMTSSSGMSFSSTSSGSIVSSGPLSSVPVATTGSVSPLATTTGTAPGEVDIGERLASLLNRGLPSPPPVSESAPTGGEASSSTRGSGRGRRKRKRRS